ncbi:hypothetical protein FHU30_003108 [Actinomadura rupiterrae]|nr:hypothetical protein [Actinomadura rupiterrae]
MPRVANDAGHALTGSKAWSEVATGCQKGALAGAFGLVSVQPDDMTAM